MSKQTKVQAAVRSHFPLAAQHKVRRAVSYEVCSLPRGFGRTLGWGATVPEAWKHALDRINRGEVKP